MSAATRGLGEGSARAPATRSMRHVPGAGVLMRTQKITFGASVCAGQKARGSANRESTSDANLGACKRADNAPWNGRVPNGCTHRLVPWSPAAGEGGDRVCESRIQTRLRPCRCTGTGFDGARLALDVARVVLIPLREHARRWVVRVRSCQASEKVHCSFCLHIEDDVNDSPGTFSGYQGTPPRSVHSLG